MPAIVPVQDRGAEGWPRSQGTWAHSRGTRPASRKPEVNQARTTTVAVSPEQLATLESTPVELVPAPPPGQALSLLALHVSKSEGAFPNARPLHVRLGQDGPVVGTTKTSALAAAEAGEALGAIKTPVDDDDAYDPRPGAPLVLSASEDLPDSSWLEFRLVTVALQVG